VEGGGVITDDGGDVNILGPFFSLAILLISRTRTRGKNEVKHDKLYDFVAKRVPNPSF